MEVVLPIKIAIPSPRVILERQIPKSKWAKTQYKELVMLDERKLRSLQNA